MSWLSRTAQHSDSHHGDSNCSIRPEFWCALFHMLVSLLSSKCLAQRALLGVSTNNCNPVQASQCNVNQNPGPLPVKTSGHAVQHTKVVLNMVIYKQSLECRVHGQERQLPNVVVEHVKESSRGVSPVACNTPDRSTIPWMKVSIPSASYGINFSVFTARPVGKHGQSVFNSRSEPLILACTCITFPTPHKMNG
jgi:hypothetical protein